MLPHFQKAFMERWPDIFCDFQEELEELGFSKIETVINGTWSNKNDDSTLAGFTRQHDTELIFSGYTKCCIKLEDSLVNAKTDLSKDNITNVEVIG
jgi:hypothetical protein